MNLAQEGVMFANKYSVRVPEGTEDASGYVALYHGQRYSLHLGNMHDNPCDATVRIDGKTIGVYRMLAHSTLVIENTVSDHGRFTWFQSGSEESRRAGLPQDSSALGLVSVTFLPGDVMEARPLPPAPPRTGIDREPVSWSDTSTYPCSVAGASVPEVNTTSYWVTPDGQQATLTAASSASGYSAGGTGLSGYSGQRWVSVPPLARYDYLREFTINLRLVGHGRRQVVGEQRSASTPVPPPVG
jgi:hypothetical protein